MPSIIGPALGFSGVVTIPPTITHSGISYEVQDISASAFENNTTITLIDASNSNLITIKTTAFKNCTNLLTLNLNNSTKLESINDEAFHNCNQMTSVDLIGCSSLMTIGNKAFKSCEYLSSISFPSSLTILGSLTFKDCKDLTSITFNGACPTDLNVNGLNIGTTPFLNLPTNAKIYVYYAYSSTNPAVGASGFATSYIRGSEIPVIVLDPYIPPSPYNPCMKCPKPVFWNTAQNISQGSINSSIMRFSNQIQQNKKRGKVIYLPVKQSGRGPPRN